MRHAIACFGVSACSLATDFDRERAIEQTALLCADSIDNDADGLTDCQDWKCAAQPACCTIPVIVLADTFEDDACSTTACGAAGPGSCLPSAERWQPWGSPLPYVCEGSFVPGKLEQCYDVGLLGKQPVPLRAGLVLTAGLGGRPEQRGRIVIGLTFQDQVQGSLDPCAPIDPAEPALSITMVSAQGGYRYIAGFGQRVVGASAILSDDARHELVIRVTAELRVDYELDDVVFATSSASETVPALERLVHVVVMGRGSSASVDDVQVTVGARCDDPAAWKMAPRFLDFQATPAPGTWDSFSVYGPSVLAASGPDPAHMYFGGCAEAFNACDPVIAGYGRTTLDADGVFVREQPCPLVSSGGLVCPGGVLTPFADVYNNVFDVDVARGPDGLVGVLSQTRGGTEIALLVEQDGALVLASGKGIEVGPANSWDAAEVCCAAIIVDDNGTRRVWYSARDKPGGVLRIGVAEWTPSGIVKSADNPVLREGPVGAFDDHGVSQPDVIWDAERRLYRMWYAAEGPLGLTSLGYAVSTDGNRWHAAPVNPVVTTESLGLRRIGAPAVISVGGELRMWIEGLSPEISGGQIYALVNSGVEP